MNLMKLDIKKPCGVVNNTMMRNHSRYSDRNSCNIEYSIKLLLFNEQQKKEISTNYLPIYSHTTFPLSITSGGVLVDTSGFTKDVSLSLVLEGESPIFTGSCQLSVILC